MRKKIEDLQLELDIKKWIESEQAAKDLCGSYDFCSKCDKEKNAPCAVAFKDYYKKEKKPVLPFAVKLELAKEETQGKFAELVGLLKENEYSIRVCKKNVTIRYKKVLFGVITLTRNSLKAHLAIDPTLFEEVPHLDYSDKKTYCDTPFTIKLTSKKSIKKTVELLEGLK